MKIYSKYLFKNVSKYFLLSLLTILSIVWTAKIVSYLKYMTKYGLNLYEFVATMSLIIPGILSLIIPFATFIAVILYYDRIGKNNELIVLRTLGLRKRQLVFPSFMLGLLSCSISYAMTLYFIPKSNILFRGTIKSIENNIINALLGNENFNTFQNITLYSESRNENEVKSLVIYISSPDNTKNKIIYAKSARIIDDSHIILYGGSIQEYRTGARSDMKILFFDEQTIDLGQFSLTLAHERSDRQNIDFMYINELLALENKTAAVKGEILSRILTPVFSVLLSSLSAAIIIGVNMSRKPKSAISIGAISYTSCLIISIVFLYSARLAKINSLGFHLTLFVFMLTAICTLILTNRDALVL